MESTNSVLIIGKPGTSKTTFLVQLYGVLKRHEGRVKLLKASDNLLSIIEGRRSLSQGKSVQSTPATQNNVLRLSLSLDDKPLELEVPDYGGEQVKTIIRDRYLETQWVEMCKNSNSWILFIRLHDHEEPHDVLTKASTEVESTALTTKGSELTHINESVELVELLQMLLATRGVGIQNPIEQPKLKLVLTLWDEFNTSESPETVLLQRYPLLLSFARSNWAMSALEVWGLSAQGFRLDTIENQDKYLDSTPEQHAYVILPNGGAPVHDLPRLFD